jgi:hypothetical protein
MIKQDYSIHGQESFDLLKEILDIGVNASAAFHRDPDCTFEDSKETVTAKGLLAESNFLLGCYYHYQTFIQSAEWNRKQTHKEHIKGLNEALAHIKDSLDIMPLSAAYLKAAVIYEELYDRENAVAMLTAGVKAFPDNIDLREEYNRFRNDRTAGVKPRGLFG